MMIADNRFFNAKISTDQRRTSPMLPSSRVATFAEKR